MDDPEIIPAEIVAPPEPVEPRRGPGRPPKITTSAVGNTSTNYTPSQERNDADQAAQPTGIGVAGFGWDEGNLADATETWQAEPVLSNLANLVAKEHDSPPPIKAGDETDRLFPVRMLRNYRPASDRWYPILIDGRLGKRPKQDDGAGLKVKAGFKIALPLSEARQLVARGLAERADDLPIA